VNNTINVLNLTLLNNTQGTNVTLTVIDEIGDNVEGAIIEILKYDVSTNDFSINQIVETNFEGDAQTDLILNSEYYKFRIKYEGVTVLLTEKTYVYGTSLTFQITLQAGGFERAFVLNNLVGNITFSNTTHRTTFQYADLSGTVSQTCFYAYRLNQTSKTLYNSSCANNHTGGMTLTVANGTGYVYSLEGYMTANNVRYLVSSKLVEYGDDLPGSLGIGLFITFLVMATIVFISPIMEVGVIISSAVPFILSVVGINGLSMETTVGVFILGLVAAGIVGLKR